jgi:hypothetical protein
MNLTYTHNSKSEKLDQNSLVQRGFSLWDSMNSMSLSHSSFSNHVSSGSKVEIDFGTVSMKDRVHYCDIVLSRICY